MILNQVGEWTPLPVFVELLITLEALLRNTTVGSPLGGIGSKNWVQGVPGDMSLDEGRAIAVQPFAEPLQQLQLIRSAKLLGNHPVGNLACLGCPRNFIVEVGIGHACLNCAGCLRAIISNTRVAADKIEFRRPSTGLESTQEVRYYHGDNTTGE